MRSIWGQAGYIEGRSQLQVLAVQLAIGSQHHGPGSEAGAPRGQSVEQGCDAGHGSGGLLRGIPGLEHLGHFAAVGCHAVLGMRWLASTAGGWPGWALRMANSWSRSGRGHGLGSRGRGLSRNRQQPPRCIGTHAEPMQRDSEAVWFLYGPDRTASPQGAPPGLMSPLQGQRLPAP